MATAVVLVEGGRHSAIADSRFLREVIVSPRIELDMDAIKEFCERWKITEFALFGSVLRDDFGPGSDVDVLVKFAPEATVTLFGLVDIEDDLTGILGRKVDLVLKRGIEESPNYLRRKAILNSAELIYAA
jgi:uncharacterized protein